METDDSTREPAAEGSTLERPEWLRDMPFWALSAILHLSLLVVFVAYVQYAAPSTEREVSIAIVSQPAPNPPYDPTRERDVVRREEIPDPRRVKDPAVERKIEVTADIPPGRVESLESFDPSLSSSILGLGALEGRRGKGGLGNAGGEPATEDAVRAALEWLRRHQAPDGSWRCADFTERCSSPCRNADPDGPGDGRGFPEHDVGVTGLALLAFAGYGHTHCDGAFPEFVACARKAVEFLRGIQVRSDDPRENGRFGPGDHEQWIYDHAIATMAMAELLIMTGDAIGLRRSVTDAARLCLRARNDGFGWRYGIKPGSNDTSVTGWMVLALKTAKLARLEIPAEDFEIALSGALRWIDRTTAANGRTGYMAPGDEGSRLLKGHPDPYPFSKEPSCMTAVGVLCRIFSGESRKSATIRDGVKILSAHPPLWQERRGKSLSTINLYYWYYGSYALFQYGGREWTRWNERMKAALLSSQRRGLSCEDGSWDPIDEWGPAGGRVYATALGAMTLEVYYRFVRQEEGVRF